MKRKFFKLFYRNKKKNRKFLRIYIIEGYLIPVYHSLNIEIIETIKIKRRGDKMNQEYLNILEKLRPIDNEFMQVLFRSEKCVELLVKTIFGDDVSVVKFKTEDKRKNLGGRSIWMDIVATLSDGKIVNIEMERSIENATPLRARYHASILDSSKSYPKQKWHKLPEMYVIFICEKDVFNTKQLVNHVQRTMDNGDLFKDKLHIIYLNASIQDESPLGLLMHDLMCEDPDNMHYKVLRKRVSHFKKTKGGRKKMCKELKKLVEEENKKAEKRGEKQGKLKIIMKILLNKFKNEDLEWVKDCNKKQIEKIEDNIHLDMSYHQFYQLVHS